MRTYRKFRRTYSPPVRKNRGFKHGLCILKLLGVH